MTNEPRMIPQRARLRHRLDELKTLRSRVDLEVQAVEAELLRTRPARVPTPLSPRARVRFVVLDAPTLADAVDELARRFDHRTAS